MAKPSKRRKAVEKRQNGVLTRQRQQDRRKAKAAKIADRLMGRRRALTSAEALSQRYKEMNRRFTPK